MEPVPLYATCSRYEGNGWIAPQPEGPRSELCPKCRGLGFVPIEIGEFVIGQIKVAGMGEILPDEGV